MTGQLRFNELFHNLLSVGAIAQHAGGRDVMGTRPLTIFQNTATFSSRRAMPVRMQELNAAEVPASG